jgi:hypothetical protein
MLYESPFSKVIALKLEADFMTSGTDDDLNGNNLEPVDYEPL